MTLIQIILTAILFFILLFSFRKKNDLLSPAKVFTMVWSVSIILAEFKFSRFQHQWSDWAWLVLFIGLISFLLGNYIPYVIFSNKRIKAIPSIRKIISSSNLNFTNMYYITIILFVIYIIAYILEVMIVGYLPIFAPRFDEARTEFGVFGLHLLVTLQLSIMVLCVEFLLLNHSERWKRKVIGLIFLITLLSFGLLLQRFSYFQWAVMSLGIAYYASSFFNYKKILAAGGIFFGVLGLIQSIRLSQYVSQFVYVISEMKYPKKYAFFTEPYMYVSMNLENLARAITVHENYSMGVLSADWLLALGGIKRILWEDFNINPRPYLISGYNTFPFFWNYYSDFGVFGMFLFPFLTGIFISTIYYHMRITAELKWVLYYSVCLMLIVISFFTNPLTMLGFVFNLFVLIFIHKYFIQKPKTAGQ